MSSSVDPRALDLKRRKTKIGNEGASRFSLKNHESFGPDESEDEIKDSQGEVSGFLRGGLQDSSNYIEPAVIDVLPRDSTGGDEGGHCLWGPASEVPAKQEANRIEESVSLSRNENLLSTNWKGTRSQPLSTSDSKQKTTCSISLAQQLQDLTGATVGSDDHSFQRFRNSNSGIESRGIPLAHRLQELVQQAQGVAPSTCLPHPQLRQVQEPTGQTGDNDAFIRARFQNSELSLETRGIPLALRLQELVQQSPAVCPSTFLPDQLRGNKLDARQHTHGKASASSTKRDRSAVEDDIVEHFGSSSHLQKSPEKDASAVPVTCTSLIWERFEEALELDAPVETNADSTDRPHSTEALSGFSKLLQNALKELTDEQTHFQKLLTSSQSSRAGLSRCLEVLILEKYLEGQLVACHCEILQSPPEWNDASHAPVTPVESEDNLTVVDVLFSSNMSRDLQLEVGRVVRVHPPWQEIHGAEQFEKIILGTFFCEMVE